MREPKITTSEMVMALPPRMTGRLRLGRQLVGAMGSGPWSQPNHPVDDPGRVRPRMHHRRLDRRLRRTRNRHRFHALPAQLGTRGNQDQQPGQEQGPQTRESAPQTSGRRLRRDRRHRTTRVAIDRHGDVIVLRDLVRSGRFPPPLNGNAGIDCVRDRSTTIIEGNAEMVTTVVHHRAIDGVWDWGGGR